VPVARGALRPGQRKCSRTNACWRCSRRVAQNARDRGPPTKFRRAAPWRSPAILAVGPHRTN
jgi:hypothetical protein